MLEARLSQIAHPPTNRSWDTPGVVLSCLLNRTPRLVRTIRGHLLCDLGGLIAKVFLIDNAILVHEKCHDTAGSIVRRKGDEAKSTGARKHAVVVPVIGCASARGVIAFFGSLGEHRSGRAFGLALL